MLIFISFILNYISDICNTFRNHCNAISNEIFFLTFFILMSIKIEDKNIIT
jgi:hypothetical protein